MMPTPAESFSAPASRTDGKTKPPKIPLRANRAAFLVLSEGFKLAAEGEYEAARHAINGAGFAAQSHPGTDLDVRIPNLKRALYALQEALRVEGAADEIRMKRVAEP